MDLFSCSNAIILQLMIYYYWVLATYKIGCSDDTTGNYIFIYVYTVCVYKYINAHKYNRHHVCSCCFNLTLKKIHNIIFYIVIFLIFKNDRIDIPVYYINYRAGVGTTSSYEMWTFYIRVLYMINGVITYITHEFKTYTFLVVDTGASLHTHIGTSNIWVIFCKIIHVDLFPPRTTY